MGAKVNSFLCQLRTPSIFIMYYFELLKTMLFGKLMGLLMGLLLITLVNLSDTIFT